MKAKMKNKKWLLSLLFLCLTVVLMVPVQSQAASTKAKALKAYRKMLAGSTLEWGESNWYVSTKNCKFAIAYIDNNSIPELIIRNDVDTYHASGYGLLYTYRKGKVQFVDVLSMNSKFYYYKKKGIFTDNYTGSGVSSTIYQKLSRGKSVTKLGKDIEYDWDGNVSRATYTDCSNSSNYKQISKSTFNRKLKKLVGSTKKNTVKFRANTKANRSRYLK